MFEKGKKEEGEEATASLIDEGMRITCSVTSSGDIILAGIVDGDINCRNLVVENNATLTGSLNTTEAVIAGNVKGDVVSDRVQILDTAHFEGDLKCSGIEVEAGAHVAARFNKRRKSKSSG